MVGKVPWRQTMQASVDEHSQPTDVDTVDFDQLLFFSLKYSIGQVC